MNLVCLIAIQIAIGIDFVLSYEIHGWRDDYREWCLVPQSQDDPSGMMFVCLSYVWNFAHVHVELLSFEPVIIVYRNFIPRSNVKAFLKDIDEKKAKEQKRVQSTNETKVDGSPLEIQMRHREGSGSSSVFDFISAMIPAVNFTTSEPWQVLSYKAGEDSPPRWDYINRTEKQMEKYGNRMATFMLLLKKATTAGHTIFPGYKITIELEEGDAVFWTNMGTNGQKSIAAFHGDCAVGTGEKVTASLRIRAKGQLLVEGTIFGFFNVGLLAQPRFYLPASTCSALEMA